jgi:hypothetical protein
MPTQQGAASAKRQHSSLALVIFVATILTCSYWIPLTDAAAYRGELLNSEDLAEEAARRARQVRVDNNASSKTSSQQDATTKKPTTIIEIDDDGVIKVGAVTYRPPFSQYGDQVAQVFLNNRPSLQNPNSVDWAIWYLLLGTAHLEGLGDNDLQEWYQLELALNAFQQAVATLRYDNDDGSSSTLTVTEKATRELFLASMYFEIGEVYSMHPQALHAKESLEYFHKALSIYSSAREGSSSDNAFYHENQASIDLRWADACTKLGALLVENLDSLSDNQGVDDVSRAILVQVEEAETLLEGAIDVYQKVTLQAGGKAASGKDQKELIQTQIALATAYQHAASAASWTGQMQVSKERNVKALRLRRDVMPYLEKDTPVWEASTIVTADILQSLSDTALLLGEYNETMKYYQEMLEWYQEYDTLEVPPMDKLTAFNDETIQDYQDALDEHHQNKVIQSVEGDEDMQQVDDEYEGGLYAAFGALHLSQEESLNAIAQLEKAVALYQRSGQTLTHDMADVKYDLATALFRVRQLQSSVQFHSEALYIYRGLYGDGVNPFAVKECGEETGLPVKSKKGRVHALLSSVTCRSSPARFML